MRASSLLLAAFAAASLLNTQAIAQPSESAPLGVLENLELLEIGGASGGLDLSPDGRFAAFIERQTHVAEDHYAHGVRVVDLETGLTRHMADAGGFIHFLTSGDRRQGAAAIRRAVWSPDGAHIAYLFGDNERIYLDVVDVATAEVRRVIDGPGEVLRFAWTNDGALVGELSTPRAQLQADTERFNREGFLVNARLEPLMGLMPEPDLRSGHSVIVVGLDSARRDASAQEVDLLSGPRSGAPSAAALRAAGGASIARVDASQNGGQPELGVSYTGADGRSQRCMHAECVRDVSGPWLYGETVLFQRVEAPTRTDTALYAWTPANNELRRIRTEEDLLIDCRLAATELICFREASAEPRRLVSIDVGGGRMRTIYEPNPQWPTFGLGRIERLDTTDAFGNPAFAHLIYPARYRRGQHYPMVIVQYRSRGFLRAGVGGEIPIHALSQRGYFVLSVERPRHVADRTRQSNAAALTEEELEGLERRSKLSALYALIDLAIGRARIDARRIGIAGMSDGAETAYWALRDSSRFAAAVISSPPLDPMSYSLVSEDFTNRARELRDRAGPWPDTPEPWATHWRDKPAVNHVENMHAPILLQLADREAMPAFPFYRRMREHGRAVDMYVYPDAYHAKIRPRQILAAQLRALAWLDFWLRDERLPEPADPDRFERWERWRSGAAPPSN